MINPGEFLNLKKARKEGLLPEFFRFDMYVFEHLPNQNRSTNC
jgi:hypothetical protein